MAVLVAVLASACTESSHDLDQCERLSGAEINRLFADVVDSAVVHDLANGRAINHWYSDGRFTSEWSSDDRSGTVVGTWRVEGDQRCVSVNSGLPDTGLIKTCSPLYRCDDRIVSLNEDGSWHGSHQLRPASPD